ncbi:Mobile element protein [Candidatus Enterovibrio altilux]|uniref:Mobile element protein n=1 Tax=Candidatus Enterovibrio altilux TaxID=1927128 RepID=A0A291BBL3_9GAMM|nr:Mobile element protein [Candidatus Enterovibrio luxaltus]
MPYPHYSCISKSAKTVHTALKMKTRGTIQRLIINFTRFKVYGEVEW